MSPLVFLFKPQVLHTLQRILPKALLPEETDTLLVDWIQDEYPDPDHQQALIDLLNKLGAIEFGHYCGDWFRELALGYDTGEFISQSLYKPIMIDNAIKLTSLGKLFIQTLFSHYINPTL